VQKLRLCVLNPRLYVFVHCTGDGAHSRYRVLKFVPDRRACGTSRTLVYRTDAIRVSPIEWPSWAPDRSDRWSWATPGSAFTIGVARSPVWIAKAGETTTAATVTYAYDQIEQARTTLEHPS
jgi:hypothetical protein